MTLRPYTAAEKLDELDRAIAALRQGRLPTARGIDVLKAVAGDLRGAARGAPGTALTELQRRIDDLCRSKTGDGFNRPALVGLGQELIGRWPSVRRALELFEEKTA